MPYHIKDARTERLLRDLARLRNATMAEVLRDALADAMTRQVNRTPLFERLNPLRTKVRRLQGGAPVDWEGLKRANDEDWGEPG